VSTSWDRRICIWDLKQGKLQDVFRNPYLPPSKEEIAADGIILDLDVCHERNEFAYASADKCAYVRKLSAKGDEMKLVAVLQDHDAEVTQVKWNRVHKQWVTGSEDRTVRIWPADSHKAIKVINNEAPVTALCIDTANGCVVTGSSDRVIRVFDGDVLVKTNLGHTDEIRSLIHMPSRNQVTARTPAIDHGQFSKSDSVFSLWLFCDIVRLSVVGLNNTRVERAPQERMIVADCTTIEIPSHPTATALVFRLEPVSDAQDPYEADLHARAQRGQTRRDGRLERNGRAV
ncbi:MAG: WD40-repeat-containing domain protein, partial [Olpidium bornovanus]